VAQSDDVGHRAPRNGSPTTSAGSVRTVPANDICESCGRDDEPLTKVQRIYLTPASGDTPASERAGDIEWWCFVCRTHYPHEVLADE